jgi:hypothetical protein
VWVANGKAKNIVPPSLLVSVAVTLIISIADAPPKFEVAVTRAADDPIAGQFG